MRRNRTAIRLIRGGIVGKLTQNDRPEPHGANQNRSMEPGRITLAPAGLEREANALLRKSGSIGRRVPLPYYCECDDATCHTAVWLSTAEYDERRRQTDGHILCAVHGRARTAAA